MAKMVFTKMVTFWEIWKRSEQGTEVTEKEFDLNLARKLRQLKKEHEISYNSEEPLPTDTNVAREVFAAAVELLCDVGVFCTSSSHIIKVREEEVKEALQSAPQKLSLGEGREQIEYKSRSPADSSEPRIGGGPCGCPVTENLYVQTLCSYAKEPCVDILATGLLTSFDGIAVQKGAPTEIAAVRQEVRLTREAAERSGRPGVCISGASSGITPAALNSADFYHGMRPNDLHIIPQLNELKVNWDLFSRLLHCQENGCITDVGQCPMIGYLGGPEETAILSVAELLSGLTVCNGRCLGFSPTSLDTSTSTDREALWVGATTILAVKGSYQPLVKGFIWAAGGPCTEMLCYELAAQTVVDTICGADMIVSAGCTRGAYVDHYTGMEARIASEVSRATVKLKAETANEVVKELLQLYEEKLMKRETPVGQKFVECYDQGRLKPLEEYLEVWSRVKKKLEELGMVF